MDRPTIPSKHAYEVYLKVDQDHERMVNLISVLSSRIIRSTCSNDSIHRAAQKAMDKITTIRFRNISRLYPNSYLKEINYFYKEIGPHICSTV